MRILIVSISDLANDPRVYRQIAHLSPNHDVTCIGTGDPGLPGVEFVPIPPRSTFGRRLVNGVALAGHCYPVLAQGFPSVHRLARRMKEQAFDLVIANDTNTLSFAFAIRNGTAILFDAHEYAPREFQASRKWRWLNQGYQDYLCREYLPRCDAAITVCPGIAAEFERCYGVRPEVITNATEYHDLEPSPVNPSKIRIIHHGIASPERRIEEMIHVMDHTDDRFSLDLMLVNAGGAEACLRRLERMADARENVAMRDPVPMRRIVETLQPYDIGLFLPNPDNFNCYNSLPNKLFEFVQARLAVAIGPGPEMAAVVRAYGLGWIGSDSDPRTIARLLNSLTQEQIDFCKHQSHEYARELSAEGNMERLDAIIERIAGSSS